VSRTRSLSPSTFPSVYEFPLSFFLRPLGALYGIGMRLRAAAYSKGLFRSWEPPVPCISIGNISWGGTGKTPLTSWLAGKLIGLGHSPVILTRGYKARPPRHPHLVRPDDDPAVAGDEPLLLARFNPKAHVVVDPVRSRSGPWAVDQFSPDVILLDDGFQHLAVRRHLDLVLLSPDDLVRDWDRVNPAGRWREGAKSLKRAHALLLNRTSGDVSDLSFRLESLDNQWFPFLVRPGGLRSIASGEYRSLGPEQPYLLITGIANPERVFHTAVDLLGRPPVETFLYPDHHAYTETDVAAIRRACDRHGAVAVTTAKDAVKLARFEDERFLVIDLTLDFPPGDHGTFPDWISARLNALGLG
jgi:tetraacyldisaccharide 4'-kinase